MENTGINFAIAGGAVLGFLLGVVLQRSQYCVRAALAQLFRGGDLSQFHAYLLAMAVAAVGTQGLVAAELIDPSAQPFLRSSVPLPGLLVGALVFGAGMMAAGGCPLRLIVRAAEGRLDAMVAWLVFVLTVMATLEGVLAPLREAATRQVIGLEVVAVPALLGNLPGWATALLLAIVVVAVLAATRNRVSAERRWPMLFAGLAIGLLAAGAWLVSVAGADPFKPAQPAGLAFVAPAQDLLRFLTMNRLGFEAKFTSSSVAGVFLGALLTALIGRRFRWRGAEGNALVGNILGAAMMGWGGVLAIGCTFGQGITGVSTLSLTSLLAVAGFVAGAFAGQRFLTPFFQSSQRVVPVR